MITLEAVNHHEKVHTDETSIDRSWVLLVSFSDFRFTYLVCALDFLNEDGISVDAVALFKDDGADLRQRLLKPLCLDLQLRIVKVHLYLAAEAHLADLSVTFLDRFALNTSQVFVGLSDVLVCLLGKKGEVWGRNHLSEDRLGPLLPRLVLILYLKVLTDKARCRLDNLNDLVL